MGCSLRTVTLPHHLQPKIIPSPETNLQTSHGSRPHLTWQIEVVLDRGIVEKEMLRLRVLADDSRSSMTAMVPRDWTHEQSGQISVGRRLPHEFLQRLPPTVTPVCEKCLSEVCVRCITEAVEMLQYFEVA